DTTKLSSKALNTLATNLATQNFLPSVWDARRWMPMTTAGAGDNQALIAKRTQAMIDLQAKYGDDANIEGSLRAARTQRGPMALLKTLGIIDPGRWPNYGDYEAERKQMEYDFKQSPEQ